MDFLVNASPPHLLRPGQREFLVGGRDYSGTCPSFEGSCPGAQLGIRSTCATRRLLVSPWGGAHRSLREMCATSRTTGGQSLEE